MNLRGWWGFVRPKHNCGLKRGLSPSGGIAGALLLVCLSAWAWGMGSRLWALPAPQASGPATPPATQTKPVQPVRVTTRMIEVSVVVSDGKGATVSGLGQDDFSLMEDGHAQKIQFFSVVRNVAHGPAIAPPPRNTFSNRYERQPDSPANVTVILFDELNTDSASQYRAREQLAKFLQGLQPTDRVGIYVLGRSLRVLQDITDDPGTLIATLKKLGVQATPQLTD
ncbi:MAG TPA: VWA domain-containing protein, partial [Candidatus Acidoferrales bacterium]|nr:VWA domain-containing protein [Candidatus Acidoferrales bacterium]